MNAGVECVGHGLFDSYGGIFAAKAVPQHQGGGQDLGQRVGDTLSGYIRGGAAGRFKQPEAVGVDTGRWQQPHGAGQHGALIRNDIAKHITA